MLAMDKSRLKKVGYSALAGFCAGLLVLVFFYLAVPEDSVLFLVTFLAALYTFGEDIAITLFLSVNTILWGSLFYRAVMSSAKSRTRIAVLVILYTVFLGAYYYKNIPAFLFEAGLKTQSSTLVKLGYATGARSREPFFRKFIPAVEGGDADVVNLLIRYKHRSKKPPADIEYRKAGADRNGRIEWIAFADNRSTPKRELLKSIFRQDEDRINALLAQGVDPNAPDMFSTSSLMIAVSQNDFALSRRLIELGAPVHLVRKAFAHSNSYSALRLALANRNVQLTQLLLQAQATLTSKDMEIALGLAPGIATENARAGIIQTMQDPERQAKILLALFSGRPPEETQVVTAEAPVSQEAEAPASRETDVPVSQGAEVPASLPVLQAIFLKGEFPNLTRISSTGKVDRLSYGQSKRRPIVYQFNPAHDMRSVAVLGLGRNEISLLRIDENGDPIPDTIAPLYRTEAREVDPIEFLDWSRDNSAIYFSIVDVRGDDFIRRHYRLNLKDKTPEKISFSEEFVAPYSDDSVLTCDHFYSDAIDLFSTLYLENISMPGKEIFLKLPGQYLLRSLTLSRDRNWLAVQTYMKGKSTPTYLRVDLRERKAQEIPIPKHIAVIMYKIVISPTGKQVAYLARDFKKPDSPLELYIDNRAVFEPVPGGFYSIHWINEDSLALYATPQYPPLVFTRRDGFWKLVGPVK